MNAMPIEWHEKCLENMKLYHKRLVFALEQAQKQVDRSTSDIRYYERQIARAKTLKKKSFDNRKFDAFGKGGA
jgi:ribosomal protein L29